MTMTLAPAFAFVLNKIFALSPTVSEDIQHAVECILRACINNVREREESFAYDRAMLIAAIIRRDADGGFDPHEVMRIAEWIREAQQDHYAAGERDRLQRIADMRARVAARKATAV